MKGTRVTSHFKGRLHSWGVFEKKKKEKKSSLFKKYAFSVDLVSLLPALETQEWLLLIWPKWSHYPSVEESGSWLTVMFPAALLRCTLHWLSNALKWAGLFLTLWWDFYQSFKALDCALGRNCTCALCLDLLCLGKWIEKKPAEPLICLLSKSAFPECRGRRSHPKYLKAVPCIPSIYRIAYVCKIFHHFSIGWLVLRALLYSWLKSVLSNSRVLFLPSTKFYS